MKMQLQWPPKMMMIEQEPLAVEIGGLVKKLKPETSLLFSFSLHHPVAHKATSPCLVKKLELKSFLYIQDPVLFHLSQLLVLEL